MTRTASISNLIIWSSVMAFSAGIWLGVALSIRSLT